MTSLGPNETVHFVGLRASRVSKPSRSWLVPEGSEDGDQDHIEPQPAQHSERT